MRCYIANKRRLTQSGSYGTAALNKLDEACLAILDNSNMFTEWSMMGQMANQLVSTVLKVTANLCVVDTPGLARQIDAGLVAVAEDPGLFVIGQRTILDDWF